MSNLTYFGDPVYTYSLKQGIEDGFLAPYKVIRVDLDKHEAIIPPKMAAALKVESGDMVRVVDLE